MVVYDVTGALQAQSAVPEIAQEVSQDAAVPTSAATNAGFDEPSTREIVANARSEEPPESHEAQHTSVSETAPSTVSDELPTDVAHGHIADSDNTKELGASVGELDSAEVTSARATASAPPAEVTTPDTLKAEHVANMEPVVDVDMERVKTVVTMIQHPRAAALRALPYAQ